ncbi:MAG: site-2 protease family protein, partial [Oscillospiraceae bacterium]
FGDVVLQMISRTAYLSCALAVFNIIPIPPLDGSKVLFSLLSEQNYWKLMRYERYGMIIMLVVMVSGVLTPVLSTVTGGLFNALFKIAEFSFSLSV